MQYSGFVPGRTYEVLPQLLPPMREDIANRNRDRFVSRRMEGQRPAGFSHTRVSMNQESRHHES